MTAMDVPPALPPKEADPRNNGSQGVGFDPWRILLMELVHLLGLFFTHARHARKARATAVFFNQIIHRLHILERMPGHEGGLIIRRIGQNVDAPIQRPDYHVLFGDIAFCGGAALEGRCSAAAKGPAHLLRSLEQAFACLNDQGIHAFYLQIPPNTPDAVDRLQLALNIVARFNQAVENGASITFRYFGRALTVPLVRDNHGRPDPNLTLVAGLNGLSAINMRQLMQQAEAFRRMAAIGGQDKAKDPYNTIFGVRNLRSQLIKPLVEINNLPWMPSDVGGSDAVQRLAEGGSAENDQSSGGDLADESVIQLTDPVAFGAGEALDPLGLDLSPQYLALHLGDALPDVKAAMAHLFDDDFGALAPDGVVKRLGGISRLLQDLARHVEDPLLIERVIAFLYRRLEQLPEALVAGMVVQRQGVTIDHQGRTLMVGMVHPRVLELILSIREARAVRRKMAVVDEWATGGRDPDSEKLADLFRLSSADCATLILALNGCFGDDDRFVSSRFVQQMDRLSPYSIQAFEILWCLLRRTPALRDRLILLSAIVLLIQRLHDLKGATGFLLADFLPTQPLISTSPYYAFRLINGMLHARQNRWTGNDSITPEEVLDGHDGVDDALQRHIVWRLGIDRVRLSGHFTAIRRKLREQIQAANPMAYSEEMDPSTLLALEREGLVLMALVGGEAARAVLHGALEFYGDPHGPIYQSRMDTRFLADLMDHLRIVLKAMTRVGRPEDLTRLKALEQSAALLMTLDTDPAHKRRVKKTLAWVAPAIRAIQVQMQ
ncbi:hypothetical protein [Desulfatitalea alkaliphila]|uniref:Uncharacterized protein n=1 Tax=Desulfatitalea alkaliphila TaxID=2929485 RepID=A0AA41R5Q2_9BACT|nr:hypothetical protein [Desulfatitalea alkaliphila]MCJ8501933.1 hypothetical protein [Desulfatitalea alkaliphila]